MAHYTLVTHLVGGGLDFFNFGILTFLLRTLQSYGSMVNIVILIEKPILKITQNISQVIFCKNQFKYVEGVFFPIFMILLEHKFVCSNKTFCCVFLFSFLFNLWLTLVFFFVVMQHPDQINSSWFEEYVCISCFYYVLWFFLSYRILNIKL